MEAVPEPVVPVTEAKETKSKKEKKSKGDKRSSKSGKKSRKSDTVVTEAASGVGGATGGASASSELFELLEDKPTNNVTSFKMLAEDENLKLVRNLLSFSFLFHLSLLSFSSSPPSLTPPPSPSDL